MARMSSSRADIRQLPEHLINQIAAGEVIERPVSVVKEVVENSLDAGATAIDIEIVAGGIDRIVVTDNGSGIDAAQLGHAVKRHWTSKISTPTDLDSITSLGFRGEALASISAVADMVITTRAADAAHAWRLESIAGGSVSVPVPAQGALGTRIEIARLFHNVPARKRFLKQARTEYLHIFRLIRHLAFARPDVAFRLTQSGSRGLKLGPASYTNAAKRWTTVFGKTFATDAYPVARQRDGLRISGWVGRPALAGNLSDTQFITLNGRMIRDRQLAHAVRLAYGDSVAPGRFPAYALALELDPNSVDVNVHPGKLEVRFVDLRALHDLLHVTIREALSSDSSHAPAVAVHDRVPAYVSVSAPTTAKPARLVHDSLPENNLFSQPLALVDDYLLYQHDSAVYVMALRNVWSTVLTRRLDSTREAAGSSRPLLLPQALADDCLLTPTQLTALRALGVDIEPLSETKSVLRSLPRVFPELDHPIFTAHLSTQLRAAAEPLAACVEAAVAAIKLGADGRPSRAVLDELVRAAAAVELELGDHSLRLDGDSLARLGL